MPRRAAGLTEAVHHCTPPIKRKTQRTLETPGSQSIWRCPRFFWTLCDAPRPLRYLIRGATKPPGCYTVQLSNAMGCPACHRACSSIRPTFADIESVARQIASVAHRTPVVTSRTFNARANAEVYFKCENFQRAGASLAPSWCWLACCLVCCRTSGNVSDERTCARRRPPSADCGPSGAPSSVSVAAL